MLNIVDNCMSACNNSMTYFATTDGSHDFMTLSVVGKLGNAQYCGQLYVCMQ